MGTAEAKVIEPELVITPAEAWAMVDELKINLEHLRKSDECIAIFRNDERYIYLPVTGATAFHAVTELLAQLGAKAPYGRDAAG